MFKLGFKASLNCVYVRLPLMPFRHWCSFSNIAVSAKFRASLVDCACVGSNGSPASNDFPGEQGLLGGSSVDRGSDGGPSGGISDKSGVIEVDCVVSDVDGNSGRHGPYNFFLHWLVKISIYWSQAHIGVAFTSICIDLPFLSKLIRSLKCGVLPHLGQLDKVNSRRQYILLKFCFLSHFAQNGFACVLLSLRRINAKYELKH